MAEKKLRDRWRALSRLQRWLIIICTGLLLYTLFGFFALPAIVRSQLEKNLSKILKRQTVVSQVKINPYTDQVEINGFVVRGLSTEEPFVSFDSLKVDLQWVSLFKRALVVKSVSLENPYFKLVRNEDLSLNFSDLLVSEEKEEEQEEAGKPFLFSINNVEISGGKIDVDDWLEGARHEITDIHLAIPFVSAIPSDVEIFVKPAFEATINGTPLGLAGASKPFIDSRHTELDLNFTGIDATKYLAYLPEDLGFTVKNGLADLHLAFFFMQHEDGKAAINIQGNVKLREVAIVDSQEEALLSFPELSVDIDRAHIMRQEFHLGEVKLSEPQLSLKLLKDGQLNLATLFPAADDQEKEDVPPTDNGLLLDIKKALIEGATLHFSDQTVSSPFQTTLAPLNVEVENFSLQPDSAVNFRLDFISEKSENLMASGVFSLDPLQARAAIELENVNLQKYRPYYENVLLADLGAEKADLAADITFSAAENSFLVSDIKVDFANLAVTGPAGEDQVVIPQFSIGHSSVDLKNKKVTIGSCSSSGGVIPLTRKKDGSLNVQGFFASADGAKGDSDKEQIAQDDSQGSDWLVTAAKLELSDYEVSFVDLDPEEAARFKVDTLHFKAENISTAQDEKGRVDVTLRLNESGQVKVGGKVGLFPLSLELDLGLSDLPLQSVQPYVEENLNIIIGKGRGAVTGTLAVEQQKEDVALAFLGNVSTSQFVLRDGLQAEKLLEWDDLVVRKLNLSTTPLAISAQGISFDGLTASVRVGPDGALNLSNLVKKTGEEVQEEEAAGQQGEAVAVEIKQVALLNSRVDFEDQSVSPKFTSSLDDIQGQVKGLSSRKDVAADVDISAKLNRHSPLTITGRIEPLQEFFTDLTVGVHDVELGHMTPYTLKYIGYPLTKGKLNLNLHYIIDGKKLTSKNKAFINQISLGDFVDSESVTKLPVPLAISLLKNRSGEISLDIPVSGEIDDPEFSVAGIVFKVLFNLIVKAATSPFSLLGSLFPDGAEVQYVQFDAGADSLVEADNEKVVGLGKALYERPSLKVELIGFADREKDTKTLTRIYFDRLIKAQKMKELLKKKSSVPDIDNIEIAAEEYERYLKKAYKAAEFDRPKNFLGFLKSLPPEEMEKLLYDHIVVTDSDLHNLASSRAKAVKDLLVASGPVESERIFLLAPETGQGQEGDLPGMRVEMVLK